MSDANHRVILHPDGRVIDASSGESLKAALARAGYFFPQNCSGKGQCGHCRVLFHQHPPRIKPREIELFGQGSSLRLACLHRVSTDCEIEISVLAEGFKEKRLSPMNSLKSAQRWLGVAVDVGTTIIAVYVVDFLRGEIIHQLSFLNPQHQFGGDVMTRLEHAKSPSNLDQLVGSLRRSISDSIQVISDHFGFDRSVFNSLLLVGNTAMTHFLMGSAGAGLEKAPFKSPFEDLGFLDISPEYFGLDAEVECAICPIIRGFIGGDITAGIIAADLDRCIQNKLFIDLGTNGEIVLAAQGELWATSTAAGPAFEGVGLQSGMPALKGAIEGFSEQGLPYVIGGGEPRGICGSGYISAFSRMLKLGIMDETGLIEKNKQACREWYPLLDQNGAIKVAQADVRKFQLAKGAIAAGIDILCSEADIKPIELDEVMITGSFGNRIDPAATMVVGLIPNLPLEKIVTLDNAAGRGALLCLAEVENRKRAVALQSKVKIVNLGGHPEFQDAFIANMYFPKSN
ncbi:MAG: ASKHA domain-containing protein [bacterium]|nr:ASKHA domain-containing protein [bacterium]